MVNFSMMKVFHNFSDKCFTLVMLILIGISVQSNIVAAAVTNNSLNPFSRQGSTASATSASSLLSPRSQTLPTSNAPGNTPGNANCEVTAKAEQVTKDHLEMLRKLIVNPAEYFVPGGEKSCIPEVLFNLGNFDITKVISSFLDSLIDSLTNLVMDFIKNQILGKICNKINSAVDDALGALGGMGDTLNDLFGFSVVSFQQQQNTETITLSFEPNWGVISNHNNAMKDVFSNIQKEQNKKDQENKQQQLGDQKNVCAGASESDLIGLLGSQADYDLYKQYVTSVQNGWTLCNGQETPLTLGSQPIHRSNVTTQSRGNVVQPNTQPTLPPSQQQSDNSNPLRNIFKAR